MEYTDYYEEDFSKLKKWEFDSFIRTEFLEIRKLIRKQKAMKTDDNLLSNYTNLSPWIVLYLDDIDMVFSSYRHNIYIRNREIITQPQYSRLQKSIIAYLFKKRKELRNDFHTLPRYTYNNYCDNYIAFDKNRQYNKYPYICPMEEAYYKKRYQQQLKKAESLVKDKIITEFVKEQKGEFAKCCNKLQIGNKQIPEVIEQHIDSFIK